MLNILSLYPQVILHREYCGKPFSRIQIPWIILQCPYDGSAKALCKQFFTEIDRLLETSYQDLYGSRRSTVDDMIRSMARLSELHGLGLLVIDEIQVLSLAKSGGGQRMLDFFLQLVNEIGLPVVLIGTYQALKLFSSNLRNGRRGTGEGVLIWDRMTNNAEWQTFVRALWRYQYLRSVTPLTKELSDTLYYLSQGITDIAVKLFMFTQIRAILDASSPENEILSVHLLNSVASDTFQIINPILEKIRLNEPGALELLDDVKPPTYDQIVEYRNGLPGFC